MNRCHGYINSIIHKSAACLFSIRFLRLLVNFRSSIRNYSNLVIFYHFTLHLPSHLHETYLDIYVILRTGLEEGHPYLLGHTFPLVEGNFPLLRIWLISNQHHHHVGGGMQFDLPNPVLYVIEGWSFINCIGHYDAHCTPIVGLSDCFEPFLSRSVPYLHPKFLALHVHCFGFEINSYLLSSIPMVLRWEFMKLF